MPALHPEIIRRIHRDGRGCLALAFGQYPDRVQSGQDHEGPQKRADHHPQHPAARGRGILWRLGLLRALAEDVLVMIGGQTKDGPQGQEHADVNVQRHLLQGARASPSVLV